MGAFAGEHQAAIPIVAFVTLALAVVAAIYRWRRDLLVALARAGARRRRATPTTPRPAPSPRVRAGAALVRLNGLRAPPAVIASLV